MEVVQAHVEEEQPSYDIDRLKCYGCSKRVLAWPRECGNRFFHEDCLTCVNCRHVLRHDDSGKIRNNAVYCRPCFVLRFRPRCDSCHKGIPEEQSITVNGKQLHQGCFRCATCSKVMPTGWYHTLNGKPYCQPRCAIEKLH